MYVSSNENSIEIENFIDDLTTYNNRMLRKIPGLRNSKNRTTPLIRIFCFIFITRTDILLPSFLFILLYLL